jgi:hypothetical protein
MTKEIKIIVIDDHEENANANITRLKHALRESSINAKIEPLPEAEKMDLIASIEQPDNWELDLNSIPSFKFFDDADIVFIDYQLGALQGHSFLTAEDVAGWIRTFSDAKLIIILNRFFDVDFDLTMNQGSIPTAADLHMNASLLECPGLWTMRKWDSAAPRSNFRPWAWPLLQEAIADIESCRADLRSLRDLENTVILDYFQFSDDLAGQMTHNALGFLDPTSKTPSTATFLKFLKNGRPGIPAEIRGQLAENISNARVKNSVINILVSSLRRWMCTMILGPQDVLIDIPHLAQRMPWLLGKKIDDPAVWENLVSPQGVEELPEVVNEFLYNKDQWLSRKCCVMPLLQKAPNVLKLYDDFSGSVEEEYVFLEDFSVFVKIQEAESFTAAFNSMWSTRYVSHSAVEAGEIHYAPKVRLV